MSDDDKQNILIVEREFAELSNQLRKIRGRPVYDTPTTPDEPPFCSFCGKGKNQVKVLVEGPSAHICNECVELCQDVIAAGKPHV